MAHKRKFADPSVKAVFDGYPKPLRAPLLALRELIFEVAGETDGLGEIEETEVGPAVVPSQDAAHWHHGAAPHHEAIVFAPGDAPPRAALKHCVELALTYHARKRGGSKKS